jgi:ankyrin repeat protein
MNYILYLAAYKGNQEIVKELLYNNAEIEAKDRHGNNPLILGILFYYSVI